MRHLHKARGLRGRLLVIVVMAILVFLTVVTAAFNVVLDRRLAAEADDALRSRASAELSALATVNGRLSVPEAPDDAALDSQVWVFEGRRVLEQPRTSQPIDRTASGLRAGPSRFANVPGTRTRLFSEPIAEGGRRLGTVVAAVSLAPYERTKRIALVASIALAVLVFVVFMFVTRWALAAALRPVSRMTVQARNWSEADPERRFALGDPYDELTELAATLDGLLGRLSAGLKREQRFSAELSHELRTPLTKLRTEAELALRRERSASEYREALERVVDGARQVGVVMETLIAAAREESSLASGRADAYRAAIAAASAAPAGTVKRVEVPSLGEGAAPVVAASADTVERVLAPLVDNACRHAKSSVRIVVNRAPGIVEFVVEDHGPGIAAANQEMIFEPGWRTPGSGAHDGAGLGLALARRLARSAGGEVEVCGELGYGRFEVRLPAA